MNMSIMLYTHAYIYICVKIYDRHLIYFPEIHKSVPNILITIVIFLVFTEWKKTLLHYKQNYAYNADRTTRLEKNNP